MTPVLAFDIETIPDVTGIRRLHDLPADLPDREVAEIAFQRRRTQTGSDFLPPQLHRVVVVSCVLRGDDGIRVFSLEGKEAERRLQRGLDTLPRLQREVFLLRAQQGMDYDSIAETLSTTPGSARVHYHHAVKKLKEMMA